jgi:hypothetical protein
VRDLTFDEDQLPKLNPAVGVGPHAYWNVIPDIWIGRIKPNGITIGRGADNTELSMNQCQRHKMLRSSLTIMAISKKCPLQTRSSKTPLWVKYCLAPPVNARSTVRAAHRGPTHPSGMTLSMPGRLTHSHRPSNLGRHPPCDTGQGEDLIRGRRERRRANTDEERYLARKLVRTRWFRTCRVLGS